MCPFKERVKGLRPLKSGEFVINPQFDRAERFSEGLASVKIGDRETYIDKTGRDICGSGNK